MTKIPKGQQQLEDQVREPNSPRERPKSWTRVKAMLNWSLGLVLAIICLTDTVDVTMTPLQKGCQEILQTKRVERQFMERPSSHYDIDQWGHCARNWSAMIWEADMLRIQREKLTKTLNQIATSQENGGTKKQGRTMERNLLFMIALGVVCQAMGHTGA